MVTPLRFVDGVLEVLDQTCLPAQERWLACRTPEQIAEAIRRLAIRGAPAIGVAAAYGLALAVARDRRSSAGGRRERFEGAAVLLGATRPTAVNLSWAIERARRCAAQTPDDELPERMLALACELHAEQVRSDERVAHHGAPLLAGAGRVLTHCNAGSLATVGVGTALGVIRAAWARGDVEEVLVDETRPLLQGARLTAWELAQAGVPYRVLPDVAAASVLARGLARAVVVGADRIAANGDVANKVGTYGLAVLAARHGVPFYVAAPRSTLDPDTPDGGQIPIEQRPSEEVTRLGERELAPRGAEALNPAFDVTPAELVRAIVTEVGVLRAPYAGAIADALGR